MGMAASQARYLGLTARKTNVEYEGQQVNQQRTALTNQSANLFNQLMALQVPTPPSVNDYTTLKYQFNDGINNEELSDITPLGYSDPNYNYTVTHSYMRDVFTGVETKLNSPQVHGTYNSGTNTYNFTQIGNSPLTLANFVGPTQGSLNNPQIAYNGTNYTSVTIGSTQHTLSAYDSSTDSTAVTALKAAFPGFPFASATNANIMKYSDNDGFIHYVCIDDLDTAYNGGGTQGPLTNYRIGDGIQKADIDQILVDQPNTQFAQDISNGKPIFTYLRNNKRFYACESDLESTWNSANPPIPPNNGIDGQDQLNTYNAVYLSKKQSLTEKASLQQDATGRFTSIKLESSSAVYDLKTTTVTDENAYQDAMNQYNYNVAIYEQEVQDINARTEIIQQEDRTLELRLKQLDTEQEALQTEMDAVKKVIDKNIETTFKTFA